MEKKIVCPKCKRLILDEESKSKDNLKYCHGCNFLFFPSTHTITRRRKEYVIPDGTNSLRYRILKDHLEIQFKWYKNIWRPDMLEGAGLLAFFFNTATIIANKSHLHIEHKPFHGSLPTVFYKTRTIKQLFVRQIIAPPNNLYSNPGHGLFCKFYNDNEELLLWNIRKRTLLYLEQEIERVVGIEDDEVTHKEIF